MITFNRISRQLINIKSAKLNFNQQCCRDMRCLSTVKDIHSKNFRIKTEKLLFNNVQNNDADIFGTLVDNIEINHKLDNLPPELDDVIHYDKDDQYKRLHITEYHKIIQELIKQHKV